jgi:hypothetical protein
MDPKELRRRHKAFWKEQGRVEALRRVILLTGAKLRADYFVEHGVWLPAPALPAFPEYPPECEGMVCGAYGRQKGRPCRGTQIYTNGRCRLHGGLSTGPKTPEGKAASAANLPPPK